MLCVPLSTADIANRWLYTFPRSFPWCTRHPLKTYSCCRDSNLGMTWCPQPELASQQKRQIQTHLPQKAAGKQSHKWGETRDSRKGRTGAWCLGSDVGTYQFKEGCAHPRKKIRILRIWEIASVPVKTTRLALVLPRLSTSSWVQSTWSLLCCFSFLAFQSPCGSPRCPTFHQLIGLFLLFCA